MIKTIVNIVGLTLIMIALCSLTDIDISNWEYWALLVGFMLYVDFNLEV